MTAEVSKTSGRGLPARVWIDTAVLTVLSVLGILGFATSFQNQSYLLAGLGGLLVGTAAALAAAWFRLGILTTALVVLVAYFLFGSAFAMPNRALFGVLPNLETLAGLSSGAVFGWADIVTLTTPVAAPDYIGVLPYISGWIVGVVSATLAARWFVARRRTALPSLVALLAPIAVYVTGVLTGTEEPYLAAIRGVSFAVIALVWMAWRVPTGQALSPTASRAVLRQKLMGVGVIGIAAVLVGGTLGFASAPTTDSRFVLRENIQPPFDPLQYPSPLSGFRKYTKNPDTPLFTVTGLHEGDRIRLATMDAYDGQLWNVTGPDLYADGSGSFNLVGTKTPPPSLVSSSENESITVTIEEYRDVWLPGIGYPESITFDRSADLSSTALRYNADTGIAVVTTGLHAGMTYDVVAETQSLDLTDDQLKSVPVATVELPPISNVPDIVAAKATELAGDAATPIEKLRAIETALSTLGFLSHGAASDQIASSAGHGADRMKLLFERNQWIGDEEQFASAFALMARYLGYPARVVMGFEPAVTGAGPVEVTGTDVTAWVEVAFDGVGWLPFYPTPTQTDVPLDQVPQPKSEPQPLVRQPPRSDTQQDDLVSAVEIKDSNDDSGAPFAIPGWVWTVLAWVGIPLALYFVPVLLIAFLKRRRRAGRRAESAPDRQAAGAWDELVDTYAELGYAAPRRNTRLQLALGFEEQFRDELAARERERASADGRSAAKQARAELKAASKEAGAVEAPATRARVASIFDATVVRAKETAAWRPGVNDDRAPLPAIPGLREFAVEADRAVFSGTAIGADKVDQLWKDSLDAVDAAHGSVSWFRRQLAKFRIRPANDITETITARLNAAVPANVRGVLSR